MHWGGLHSGTPAQTWHLHPLKDQPRPGTLARALFWWGPVHLKGMQAASMQLEEGGGGGAVQEAAVPPNAGPVAAGWGEHTVLVTH